MEGSKVKLLGLGIQGLYGYYDYMVDFNADVTFIYGLNGCGKTTVLNITEAIITGQLFKLFGYKFREIKLKYANSLNLGDGKEIGIRLIGHKIAIKFNGKDYNLCMIEAGTGHLPRNMRSGSFIASEYFQRYNFLKEIRETFNYVYLPLSRSYVPDDEDRDDFGYERRVRYGSMAVDDADDIMEIDNRDRAMIKIEGLIFRQYSMANTVINRINDSFRDSMLKPQIELNKSYSIDKIVSEMLESNILNLKSTQEVYIKILKEFRLISGHEEDDYNKFFEGFITDFSDFDNKKDKPGLLFELVLKYQEISRIQKTIELANKMEKQKTEIFKPIKTFQDTMNSFIGDSEDGKEICIDRDGRVYFKTSHSGKKISIQHLSSGEKQLITFLANLIFKVTDKSSGIFVVDEPELSLHLSWQKIFVDKVLEINKNVQLIFATHAPEIIGRRRDKMCKLEKHYTKVEPK